jgi:hypothetical protein
MHAQMIFEDSGVFNLKNIDFLKSRGCFDYPTKMSSSTQTDQVEPKPVKVDMNMQTTETMRGMENANTFVNSTIKHLEEIKKCMNKNEFKEFI